MYKKMVCMVLAFIFAVSVWYAYAEIIKDNKERRYEESQYFDNPIVEGASKVGQWKNAPNTEIQDPKNYLLFFDDFTVFDVSATANGDIWLASRSMTNVLDSAPGGQINFYSGDMDTDLHQNMQVNGESFQVQKDKPMYFEARMTPSFVGTQPGFFVGLATTDTNIIGGAGGGTGATTMLGFRSGVSDTASIYADIRSNSNEYLVDTGVDQSSSTAVRLGFSVDNSVSTGIAMYVNDNLVSRPCTSGRCTMFLDSSLPIYVTPTFEFMPNANAVWRGGPSIKLDYIKAIQKR